MSLTVKILTDSIFYLVDSIYSPLSIVTRVIISVIIMVSLIYYYFKNIQNSKYVREKDSIESFIYETIQISIFLFLLIVFSGLIPDNIIDHGNPGNILDIIIINLYAFFSLIAGIFILRFLYKWLWINRHKSTKLNIKILSVFLLIFLLTEIPIQFNVINSEEIIKSDIVVILSAFINIIALVILFVTASKNIWIAELNRKNKWKVFFSVMITGIISIIALVFGQHGDGEGKVLAAYNFIFSSGTLFVFSVLLLLAYLSRILLSIISSFPTTSLVERRISEVGALTYLNKLITQTTDFDSLIQTITSLSLYSGRGSGAWTLINIDNKVKIFSENIIKEHLNIITNDVHINKINPEHPLYIDSVRDTEGFESFLKMNVKSIIILPLNSGNNKIGNLFIVHPDEYAFDKEYLKILVAFSDNINIALEKERLVQESISKEKYKQELMIARDIAQKLIPDQLPSVEGFEIFAKTIPSEEVGGDYYDIVTLKNGKQCLITGDVSGKGMSAAFYMAVLKGVVLANAMESYGPSDLLIRINNSLYNTIKGRIFITLSAVVFNDTNELICSRAGHLPFLFMLGGKVNVLTPGGIGIGLADSLIFNNSLEEIKIKLIEDECCIIVSDGILEMIDKHDTNKSIEILKHFLENTVYTIKEDFLELLIGNVVGKNSEIKYHDDSTVVFIRKIQ